MQTITCRRCGETMEEGFLADNASSGYILQAAWYAGPASQAKFLGMNLGTLNTKDRAHHALVAYRCPACYGMEFFAPPEDEAKTRLLRAASESGMTDANELLRGGETPQ